jgi:hypothetical protein
MDKTATAPSMTVVSAALPVAAGAGCSEVFDTAIFEVFDTAIFQSGRRQAEEGGRLIH